MSLKDTDPFEYYADKVVKYSAATVGSAALVAAPVAAHIVGSFFGGLGGGIHAGRAVEKECHKKIEELWKWAEKD